ncbi:MAG: 3-phosphoshikimate 1-carboxyvinyltransferase [Halococcoides sp.]
MDVTLTPATVTGQARAPPSKSYTHRAILAAGYSPETATVRNPLVSADTQATMAAVEAFGGSVERDDDAVTITGFDGRPDVPDRVVNCENSGTTMRLTTATASLADGLVVLTGDESLRSRPQGPLLDAIEQLGGRAESTRANGQAPLVVGGPIDGGRAAIPGDVSSQFISALLMAGAVTPDGVTVDLETALKSAPYVEITLDVLEAFGVTASGAGREWSVTGGQSYAASDGEYRVPGDFSSMSYLLSAGALAAPEGLRVIGAEPSAQGDVAIVEHLQAMGAPLRWDRAAGTIDVERGALEGIEASVADTPDLLPTLAAVGAAADGTTRIVDCEHVRYKETDRVAAMADELGRMGASVTEHDDELLVHGSETDLSGARVDGRGDHRIVMALALAGLVADGETTIRGAEHVDVSFPGFFETMADLGVDVDRN